MEDPLVLQLTLNMLTLTEFINSEDKLPPPNLPHALLTICIKNSTEL